MFAQPSQDGGDRFGLAFAQRPCGWAVADDELDAHVQRSGLPPPASPLFGRGWQAPARLAQDGGDVGRTS